MAAGYGPQQLADPSLWVAICEGVDRAVAEDPVAGFTTLVTFALGSTFITGASSGDIMASLWTEGHMLVLTERQFKNPPVGSGGARITPFSALLAAGSRVFVATDGVWKYVGWDRIAEHIGSLAGAALIERLRTDAVANTGQSLRDDFTAVVIDL
jgi:hypothetical protein